ncbi:MAG: glycosyltransferase family 4 protein [Candidatus Thorarchaeota archaeon]
MSTAKRVLMIAPRYRPAVGGIERHLEKVTKILVEKGLSVTILAPTHVAGLTQTETIDKVNIIRIPFGWDRNPFLSYLWMISRRLNLKRYSIVHVHGTMPLLSLYLPLRLLNGQIPVYATFHGFERDPVPAYFKVMRRIARRLVRRSLCIGHFIRTIYGEVCDLVSIGAVDQPERQETERGGLVYIGRIEKDTGIADYIEAMRILSEKYSLMPQLTVYGRGYLQEKLERIADSHGLKVDFAGLAESSTKGLRSKLICLGAGYLSMLEAMSLGLPVVTVAATQLKYEYHKGVLTEGGHISIQTTAERVADEIARLLKNPELIRRISRRGVEFTKKMTWENLAKLYIEMWKHAH